MAESIAPLTRSGGNNDVCKIGISRLSFIEKRNEIRPATGEAPFSVDELFFSRTDDRGVIEAGNYVFRRVANFSWDEMIGAPHRIIRHPDMPKAVFWLLWNRIKQGKPIGAYVKNRAKDGLYYWVFAVVAPNGKGYLSARIKPTSPILDLVETEYASLLAAENAEGLSPEQSANRLLHRLDELGYPDYDQFATLALSEELVARDIGMGVAPDSKIEGYREMLEASERLSLETQALIDEFAAMRTIPHNMRVIASRLEPTGGPVSTLSKNYGAISLEMSNWFQNNVVGENSNFATINRSVYHSMFLEGVARIFKECELQLNEERRQLGLMKIGTEREILARRVSEYEGKSTQGLAQVREEAARILRACATMNRHILGLSSTRVLCKIESSRAGGGGDGLEDIIRQLGTFQERISNRLDHIAQHSQQILDQMS